MTPLHFAALKDHKEIVELLIAAGADVNAKNKNGYTPLDMADDVEGIAALLRKHGGKHGTIHGAAAGGDTEGVKEFLAAGTDVNAKDYFGDTPLDDANGETADLLRKHGGKTGEELKAEGKPTDPVAEAAQPEPPTAKTPDALFEELKIEELIRKNGGKEVNIKLQSMRLLTLGILKL